MPQIKKTVKAKNDQKCILYSCQRFRDIYIGKIVVNYWSGKVSQNTVTMDVSKLFGLLPLDSKINIQEQKLPISSIVPIS